MLKDNTELTDEEREEMSKNIIVKVQLQLRSVLPMYVANPQSQLQ